MSILSMVPVAFNSSGSTLSNIINGRGMSLVGVICSSAINSTALTFLGAPNGNSSSPFGPVLNSTGGAVTVQVSTSAYVVLNQNETANFNAIDHYKFAAGTLEVAGSALFTAVFQPRRQS